MPNGNEGSPLRSHTIVQIRKLRQEGMSVRRVAALAGVSKSTVMKYTTHISEARQAKSEAPCL